MIELLPPIYKVIRKVGKGGMAEVFLAQDKNTLELFAIKILSPDKSNNYSEKMRFQSEIKLMQKVNSEYVVKIYDWTWDKDKQFIVMEYVEGESLKHYISSKSRLNVDEVVEFGKQLALGFQEIHNKGIVHRDIKSSNIIIDTHNQVKIIDFGIAITKESERYTKVDSIIGSVYYIAPELIDQSPPTPKSDIYSFGILLFEMLTGRLPYKSNEQMAILNMHQKRNVPEVNKIFPDIPQSVANIIIKATTKDPNKRYDSMYDVYRDLSTALSKERLYEQRVDLTQRKKHTLTSIMNSKNMLLGIITTTFLILIAMIVILVIVVV